MVRHKYMQILVTHHYVVPHLYGWGGRVVLGVRLVVGAPHNGVPLVY
jgi:hypothetical protein